MPTVDRVEGRVLSQLDGLRPRASLDRKKPQTLRRSRPTKQAASPRDAGSSGIP